METIDAHYQLLLADRLTDEAFKSGRPEVQVQIDLMTADELREEAAHELRLDEPPRRGVGNELVKCDRSMSPSLDRQVLQRGKVATNASVERLNLIHSTGVFDLALDTAESIGAENAIEKMVAHGIAAAHKTAMNLLEKSNLRSDPIDEVRRINAAARLLAIVQQGALTIQRLRTGGAQTVTVRHVTVEQGGQAVIGNVNTTAGAAEK